MIFMTEPDDRTTVHGFANLETYHWYLSLTRGIITACPKLGSRYRHWYIQGTSNPRSEWRSVTNDLLTARMMSAGSETPPGGDTTQGKWRFKITYRTPSGGVKDYEVEAHTMIGALAQSRPSDVDLLLSIELKGEA